MVTGKNTQAGVVMVMECGTSPLVSCWQPAQRQAAVGPDLNTGSQWLLGARGRMPHAVYWGLFPGRLPSAQLSLGCSAAPAVHVQIPGPTLRSRRSVGQCWYHQEWTGQRSRDGPTQQDARTRAVAFQVCGLRTGESVNSGAPGVAIREWQQLPQPQMLTAHRSSPCLNEEQLEEHLQENVFTP